MYLTTIIFIPAYYYMLVFFFSKFFQVSCNNKTFSLFYLHSYLYTSIQSTSLNLFNQSLKCISRDWDHYFRVILSKKIKMKWVRDGKVNWSMLVVHLSILLYQKYLRSIRMLKHNRSEADSWVHSFPWVASFSKNKTFCRKRWKMCHSLMCDTSRQIKVPNF